MRKLCCLAFWAFPGVAMATHAVMRATITAMRCDICTEIASMGDEEAGCLQISEVTLHQFFCFFPSITLALQPSIDGGTKPEVL